MSAEQSCRDVQARLTDDFLAHRQHDAGDLDHTRSCVDCGAHGAELVALADALDRAPAPELQPERAAALLRRAAEELAAAPVIRSPASTEGALPPGYRRELARLLMWATLPLLVVLPWYAALFRVGGSLLGNLLPQFFVAAIGFAFVAATSSWLALIYGSIPFIAHRRVLRRQWEQWEEREVMA